MSNLALVKTNISPETIEKLILKGDLSSLPPEQKVSYYNAVCQSVGLNPLTNPFAYIKLNGKEVLYATKACTDQIRAVHKVSIKITARELIGDVYTVTAQARYGDREDESTGALNIKGLTGDALANAYMKAETKAKRRVTLSVCGLGLLDETEVETIPGVKKIEAKVVETNVEPASKTVPSQGAGSYVIPFGKQKGTTLADCDHAALAKSIGAAERGIEEDAEWVRKVGPDRVQEFIINAMEYLNAVEESENA